MVTTINALKEALAAPFPIQHIQLLPHAPFQEQGRSYCLAFPYANKRIYEDRLNTLLYGEWSTPATVPYAQGNKLIIPVTVVIRDVAHTDYGEAFFTAQGKGGTTQEAKNSATEAYSQAFRRACAKFLLGRYLYDLPIMKVPYDPQQKRIQFSTEERLACVAKMYRSCGLTLAVPADVSSLEHQETAPTLPAQTVLALPSSHSSEEQAVPTSHSSEEQVVQITSIQPASYPNNPFLDWVAVQVSRDPVRIQGICQAYGVSRLSNLNTRQREDLTLRLRHQAAKAAATRSRIPARASRSMGQSVTTTVEAQAGTEVATWSRR